MRTDQDAHNRVVDSVADRYRNLLWKREKYRMEAYTFSYTSVGWVALLEPINPIDTVQLQKLDVHVAGAKDYVRTQVYIVYENIKSIYHLEQSDKETFFVGQDLGGMWMMKNKPAKIVAICYRGNEVSMGVTNYITCSSESAEVKLTPTTNARSLLVLREVEKGTFDGNIAADKDETHFEVSSPSDYAEENSIAVDLQYQDFFYREQQYRDTKAKENKLVDKLAEIAFPCLCGERCQESSVESGRKLFQANCRSCHSINEDGTGPPLAGMTKRQSLCWLKIWIRNWNNLVYVKDYYAVKMAESRPAAMNTFPTLTDCDIESICLYVEAEEKFSK